MSIEHARQRRWLYALHAAGVVIATLQRGVWNPGGHTTFAIFRQSFLHLQRHQNLYALYPAETGGGVADLFKYSPSAAVFLAPLSLLPFALALLLWNAASVASLIAALKRIVPDDRLNLALLLLVPEVFVSIQASSSNTLVTALILFAATTFVDGRQLRASIAMVTGTAIKIFPAAIFVFALMERRRMKALLSAIAVAVLVLLLPLLFIPPSELVQQYRWWIELERSDALDVAFGLSMMRLLREWTGYAGHNWPVQACGVVALVAPLLLHRRKWAERDFRLQFLASLLVFVVLFNHQAERQSFVIAATGSTIWFVCSARSLERALLLTLALVGVPTFPYLVLWLVIHLELVAGMPSVKLETVRKVRPILRTARLRRYVTGSFRAAS